MEWWNIDYINYIIIHVDFIRCHIMKRVNEYFYKDSKSITTIMWLLLLNRINNIQSGNQLLHYELGLAADCCWKKKVCFKFYIWKNAIDLAHLQLKKSG